MQALNMVHDINIPEISSTASTAANRSAFYKKLKSQKYKCILNMLMISLAFIILIWFALLSRATIVILQNIKFNQTMIQKELNELLTSAHKI